MAPLQLKKCFNSKEIVLWQAASLTVLRAAVERFVQQHIRRPRNIRTTNAYSHQCSPSLNAGIERLTAGEPMGEKDCI